MNRFYKHLAVVTLGLTTTMSMATPPRQLITHNKTNVESNGYVAGTIPSRYPTKAHSDGKVTWTDVRMACYGHIVNGLCPALIRVATGPNDGGNPIDIGEVSVDLNTGIITPSHLSANGYSITVNGPGETTLTKD